MDISRNAVQMACVGKGVSPACTIPNVELVNVATRIATARRIVTAPGELLQGL